MVIVRALKWLKGKRRFKRRLPNFSRNPIGYMIADRDRWHTPARPVVAIQPKAKTSNDVLHMLKHKRTNLVDLAPVTWDIDNVGFAGILNPCLEAQQFAPVAITQADIPTPDNRAGLKVNMHSLHPMINFCMRHVANTANDSLLLRIVVVYFDSNGAGADIYLNTNLRTLAMRQNGFLSVFYDRIFNMTDMYSKWTNVPAADGSVRACKNFLWRPRINLRGFRQTYYGALGNELTGGNFRVIICSNVDADTGLGFNAQSSYIDAHWYG